MCTIFLRNTALWGQGGRSCTWRNCPKNCSKNANNLYRTGMGDYLLYYLKNTRSLFKPREIRKRRKDDALLFMRTDAAKLRCIC